MRLVRDVAELDDALTATPVPRGLVPTMGALHAGHLSLVRAARSECATVVVSVFVNPLQFGAGEDFDEYPRTFDADLATLEQEGVDVVFAPPADFAPDEPMADVPGPVDVLEGASRPGHFAGVATIVRRLLDVVDPDRAYFGEKDYQQLVVIRALVERDGLRTQIVGCPVVRDADGLALSSRNVFLSPAERARALHLSAALMAVAGAWDGDADTARVRLRSRLADADGVELDYAEIVHPETLEPLDGIVTGPARALVAARVGATRLIDNVPLAP